MTVRVIIMGSYNSYNFLIIRFLMGGITHKLKAVFDIPIKIKQKMKGTLKYTYYNNDNNIII